MILVDSSVWIDFFSQTPGAGGRELRHLIEASEPLALTGVVVTEVLQGFTRDASHADRYLRIWDLLEPQGFSTYQKASVLFRLARARGFTLSTVDALIATVALEHGAVLFSLDQDFNRIASFTGLKLHAVSG
ncbi:MAG TPA: PIN domain nuclease [Terriglobia bacterium]|nr:PIN domain nuclease [Terriglobia bacterium]